MTNSIMVLRKICKGSHKCISTNADLYHRYIAWRTIEIYRKKIQLPGVDFINIFGEKRMAKSAKSPAYCRKKIELCAQKIFEAFFGIWQPAKSSFLVIRTKKP
jgi:hypothetical protein